MYETAKTSHPHTLTPPLEKGSWGLGWYCGTSTRLTMLTYAAIVCERADSAARTRAASSDFWASTIRQ
eukprot:6448254-Prymnesium_polylepis.1